MVNLLVQNENYSGLNPVQCGYERCESGHPFGPAVRSYWLLHFVVSGKGIFEVGGKHYNLKQGNIFVIKPGVQTFYKADDKDPWEYIWIGFTASGDLPKDLTDVIYCPQALSVFSAMKSCESYQSGTSAYLSGKLWELFALLLSDSKSKPDYAQSAQDIIHAQYMLDISVNTIADALSLNRSYLSAIFKEKYGISPKKYLLNYRMKTATQLLKNNISVSTTANSVGYTDIYTFSKRFKEHFGVSPSVFARQ